MSDTINENDVNPYAPGTETGKTESYKPYVPNQGMIHNTPHVPQNGTVQPTPIVPQTGTVKPTPYVPSNGGVQPSPYAPQTGGVQPSPYAPQTGGVQPSPYAPQTGGVQPSPYAPQTGGVQPNPYVPTNGGAQPSPYAPQQGTQQANPYIPNVGVNQNNPYIPNQSRTNAPQNSAPAKKKPKVGLIILFVALGVTIPVVALALFIVFGVFGGFPKGGVESATSVAYTIVDSLNNRDKDSYLELIPEEVKNDSKEQEAVNALFDSLEENDSVFMQISDVETSSITDEGFKKIKSNFKKATGKSIKSAENVKYSYEIYDYTGNQYVVSDEVVVVRIGVKYYLYDDYY